jgi:alkylhydroperoxidase family enzyme
MSWLGDLPEGKTDWDRFSLAFPEVFDALAGLFGAPWQDCDPTLLELARLRIATLLRNDGELNRRSTLAREAGLSEAKVAELAAWPTSPLFTPRERACLNLTEQFLMDANGVTEEQVAEVMEHLGGAGCYAFVEGLSAMEAFQRACLVLGISTAPGVDDMVGWAGRKQTPTEVAR